MCGPIIYPNSFEDDDWCKKNTQYLFVEQELMEVNLDQEIYLDHI